MNINNIEMIAEKTNTLFNMHLFGQDNISEFWNKYSQIQQIFIN